MLPIRVTPAKAGAHASAVCDAEKWIPTYVGKRS